MAAPSISEGAEVSAPSTTNAAAAAQLVIASTAGTRCPERHRARGLSTKAGDFATEILDPVVGPAREQAESFTLTFSGENHHFRN